MWAVQIIDYHGIIEISIKIFQNANPTYTIHIISEFTKLCKKNHSQTRQQIAHALGYVAYVCISF